jgi:hypothetical protein
MIDRRGVLMSQGLGYIAEEKPRFSLLGAVIAGRRYEAFQPEVDGHVSVHFFVVSQIIPEGSELGLGMASATLR